MNIFWDTSLECEKRSQSSQPTPILNLYGILQIIYMEHQTWFVWACMFPKALQNTTEYIFWAFAIKALLQGNLQHNEEQSKGHQGVKKWCLFLTTKE